MPRNGLTQADAGREVVVSVEAVGKQRFGRRFDVIDQALEDIVEQADLFVRKVHRAVDEEIGYAAQGLDPAGNGSVRERGLQLVEQVDRGGSGLRTHMTLSWSKADDGFSVSGTENGRIRRWRCDCVPVPWLRKAHSRRARGKCPGFPP